MDDERGVVVVVFNAVHDLHAPDSIQTDHVRLARIASTAENSNRGGIAGWIAEQSAPDI